MGSAPSCASTPSACRTPRLSHATSARIGVASRWTTSPLAMPAATRARTVRANTARNRSAPQRLRIRLSEEWSGSCSCRPKPANQRMARLTWSRAAPSTSKQPAVVDDAEQETGQHQPQRRLRIDDGSSRAVRAVAVPHRGPQPGQVEDAIDASEDMAVGHRIAQRSPAHIVAGSIESERDRFFNSPRVHWTSNTLAYVPRAQATIVAASIRQAFQQPDQAAARASLHHLGDQLHNRWPKLKAFVEGSIEDVLAYMIFPAQHRAKLHGTNPLERLTKELKRRADVVGIFPGKASITRLIGAVLLEADDEWQLQQRYMPVEAMAALGPPLIEGEPVPSQPAETPPQGGLTDGPLGQASNFHHLA